MGNGNGGGGPAEDCCPWWLGPPGLAFDGNLPGPVGTPGGGITAPVPEPELLLIRGGGGGGMKGGG